MPRRTNERQRVIAILKEMLAGPDCTVTESKLLVDSVTGTSREVDVVAEWGIDGDTFVQSYEVTSTRTRADLTWAEQLIRKHENLSTDRLFLVSWGGVTQGVVDLVGTRPDVQIITPESLEGTEGGEVSDLFVYTAHLKSSSAVAVLVGADGEVPGANLELDDAIFSEDESVVGSVGQLCQQILYERKAVAGILHGIHEHPEKEYLDSFFLDWKFEVPKFYVRMIEPNAQTLLIKSLAIRGTLTYEQTPLQMEVRRFQDHLFAHGRASILNSSGIVVALLDSESEVTELRFAFTKIPESPLP